MNFDFPLILVLASAFTGAVWALDALVWARRRAETAKEPTLVEYSKAFFPVIFAVLILRSFVAEPFRIPSGSMMPTLLVGDFILVNKFAYGLRLPVLHSKVFDLGEPQRGDVVVFRYPEDPSIDYIKRVVGVAGDRIAYHNKILYINGVEMPQTLVGSYIGVGSGVASSGAELREEQLSGVAHQILVRPGANTLEGEVEIPPGYYFMMGDNRDNSKDSRYFGPVPEGNLVGKAFMIWMNWDRAAGGVDWGRLGQSIH
ncbi:MAG: signal peptidase I [Gammaproteobacteria bacterium]